MFQHVYAIWIDQVALQMQMKRIELHVDENPKYPPVTGEHINSSLMGACLKILKAISNVFANKMQRAVGST